MHGAAVHARAATPERVVAVVHALLHCVETLAGRKRGPAIAEALKVLAKLLEVLFCAWLNLNGSVRHSSAAVGIRQGYGVLRRTDTPERLLAVLRKHAGSMDDSHAVWCAGAEYFEPAPRGGHMRAALDTIGCRPSSWTRCRAWLQASCRLPPHTSATVARSKHAERGEGSGGFDADAFAHALREDDLFQGMGGASVVALGNRFC